MAKHTDSQKIDQILKAVKITKSKVSGMTGEIGAIKLDIYEIKDDLNEIKLVLKNHEQKIGTFEHKAFA